MRHAICCISGVKKFPFILKSVWTDFDFFSLSSSAVSEKNEIFVACVVRWELFCNFVDLGVLCMEMVKIGVGWWSVSLYENAAEVPFPLGFVVRNSHNP